ncbi:MAG: glycosyltransferase [Nitrospira sp.]|nr:glycosyltransferase [Nitrospira sp.]
MKKILLIAYHFPPSTEVGGVRLANFAAQLPRLGWSVRVLTVKDRYVAQIDHERLKHLGEIEIDKVGRLPTLSDGYLWLKRVVRPALGRSAIQGWAPSARANQKESFGESMGARLRRYALSFLSLPDSQRSWVWPAVLRAVSIIKRNRIDVILTSCPPYSAHLVGLVVKWLTNVQWVADFRDPWMATPAKSLYHTCAASVAIERWLERKVFQSADLVVSSTGKLTSYFMATYGEAGLSKAVTITNGYDGEVAACFKDHVKASFFTMTYAGSLYFGRTPEPIFQAVQDLVSGGSIPRHSIRIKLVGHCGIIDGVPTEKVADRYGLREILEVRGPVSQLDALRLIKQSHIALLLAPNQPFQIPAKLYEYMGMQTVVLAIAEAGATQDLMERTRVGWVFRPSDVAGVRDFIMKSYGAFVGQGDVPFAGEVESFESNRITRALAEHLDRICATSSCNHLVVGDHTGGAAS